jgi:ATP-binding cassette subfamily B protein
MSAITQESLSVSGVLLAKVFGRQDRDAAATTSRTNSWPGCRCASRSSAGRSSPSSPLLLDHAGLVYLVAGLQLADGNGPSAGTIIAFTTLQTRLFMPIGQLLQTSTEISSSLALFGECSPISTCDRRSLSRRIRSGSPPRTSAARSG